MRSRPRASRSLSVVAFLIFGVVQTLFALVVFQRADDHTYFLDVAENGAAVVALGDSDTFNLKTTAAATAFYALAAPARWIGVGETGYVIWMRLITLAGFLLAFEWARRSISRDDSFDADRPRNRFMLLCLLYPGQLAWTSSLLRDGPACAFLFASLLAWSYRARVTSLTCIAASLALRPEFAIVAVVLAVCVRYAPSLNSLKRRLALLFGACILMSAILFEPRSEASEFAQLAFADAGAAFPVVSQPFDMAGYAAVLAQALIDPMPLSDLTPSLFSLAEAAFFVGLLFVTLRRLPRIGARAAGLLIGVCITFWLLAYFEVFVSGFSRHRMALEILLIAVAALTPAGRQRSTDSRHLGARATTPLGAGEARTVAG